MEIDTSKLQPGMVVKNYKELCELLGIPIKTGASKKKQMKEIGQVISYDKKGYSFIIKEVQAKPVLFSTPLPRRDRRKKKPKNIYIKFVELILMQYLTQSSNEGTLTSTKINLFKLLGLVNYKFNMRLYEKEFIEQHSEMPNIKQNLNHVKSKAYNKMDSILSSSLRSLENKRIITTSTVIYITTINGNTYEASDKEITQVTEIEYEIMQKLGVREYWELFSKDLSKQYYTLFEQALSELGWKYAQRKIKILFTNSIIVNEIKRTELELQKMLLNEEFVEFLTENIDKYRPLNCSDDFSSQYNLIIQSFIAYLAHE